MLKPMPNKLLQIHKDIDKDKSYAKIDLNNFFVAASLAIIKCEIETPNNILKPILPYKYPTINRTIYPIGKWTDIYVASLLNN
jgi:hypothetical protein